MCKSDLDAGHICETFRKWREIGNRDENLGCASWIFRVFLSISINFPVGCGTNSVLLDGVLRHKSCHLSSFLSSSKTPEIVATLGWVKKLPFESKLIWTAGTYTDWFWQTPRIGWCSHYFSHVFVNLSLLYLNSYCLWASEDLDSRLQWSKVDIPKSKFALLKGINIKHPDIPESTNIQLHPDGEFEMEITLTLEEGEEILGFQFHEAPKLKRCR